MFDNLKLYVDSKLYQAKEAECPENLEYADHHWEETQVILIDRLQAAMNVLDSKCEADVEQFKLGIRVVEDCYKQMVVEITSGVQDELAQLEQIFFEKMNHETN